jgi:hypothetical protein
MLSQTISSRKIKQKNDKVKDKEHHIKRPANSFMIWAQTYRKKVFEDNTTLNNAEISKLLGQQWKNLSNEEKQIYKDKADQVKQEHKIQYPNYKYRPERKIETIKTKSCKKTPTKTIKTNTFKNKKYMPLTININKPKTKHSLNEKSKKKINTSIKHTINSKMNLNINFNDNWLTYKEGYNYYEDIELFYSKL